MHIGVRSEMKVSEDKATMVCKTLNYVLCAYTVCSDGQNMQSQPDRYLTGRSWPVKVLDPTRPVTGAGRPGPVPTLIPLADCLCFKQKRRSLEEDCIS